MITPRSLYAFAAQTLKVFIYPALTTVNYPSKNPGIANPIPGDPEAVQAGGATGLSEIIEIGGSTLTEITTGPDWVAAPITVLSAQDDGTEVFSSLRTKAGVEYSIPSGGGNALPSTSYLVDPFDFCGIDRFKLRSGTNATPVTQTGTGGNPTVLKIRILKQGSF